MQERRLETNRSCNGSCNNDNSLSKISLAVAIGGFPITSRGLLLYLGNYIEYHEFIYIWGLLGESEMLVKTV